MQPELMPGEFFAGAKADVVPFFKGLSVLASGAYGTVVRAVEADTGRAVAIKRIPNCFQNAREALHSARELRLLDACRHPNIVRMRSVLPPHVGIFGFNTLFIVMDYGGANDLRKIMDARTLMKEGEVRSFMVQLLAAIQHIHALLCIHRDIKPDNVLISRERRPPSAPYGLLRLCDFGLSRIGLHAERVEEAASAAGDGGGVGGDGGGASGVRSNGGKSIGGRMFAVVLGGGRGRTETRQEECHVSSSSSSASSTGSGHATGSSSSSSGGGDGNDADKRLTGTDDDGGGGAAADAATATTTAITSATTTATTTSSSSAGTDLKPALLRQQTTYVVSRWYRAPEVILEEEYGPPIDIWAVGCMFKEMIELTRLSSPPREPPLALFPGGCCSPWSVKEYRLMKDGEREPDDQLGVLMRVLGTPRADEMHWASGAGRAQVLGVLPGQLWSSASVKSRQDRLRQCLKKASPNAKPNELDLLTGLLVLDPNRRLSPGRALKHDYFSGLPAKQRAVVTPTAAPDKVGEAFAFERQREVHTSLEALKALVTGDVDRLSAVHVSRLKALEAEAVAAQEGEEERGGGGGGGGVPRMGATGEFLQQLQQTADAIKLSTLEC